MSQTSDVPKGQRKPKPGVAGEVPWGPALSGPCENNGPEYTIPGRAAGDNAAATKTSASVDQRVIKDGFAVRTLWQDGHHPEDRGSLTDAQIGQGVPHEHDDWKRSPPEVIDQDPTVVRTGWHADSRVPDDKKRIMDKPGDKLGP